MVGMKEGGEGGRKREKNVRLSEGACGRRRFDKKE
jgi:hypothetical protein